jgi:hypothetical protein
MTKAFFAPLLNKEDETVNRSRKAARKMTPEYRFVSLYSDYVEGAKGTLPSF